MSKQFRSDAIDQIINAVQQRRRRTEGALELSLGVVGAMKLWGSFHMAYIEYE